VPVVRAGVAISGETCRLLRQAAILAAPSAPRACQEDLAAIVQAGNAWLQANNTAVVLTVEEYARREGVSQKSIYRALKAGRIVGANKHGRAWRIKLDARWE
jgi:excisionase family DNA binding protein